MSSQTLDLFPSLFALLGQSRDGLMTGVAYDTAWIARLDRLGEPAAQEALEWLRETQLPDGSWGARAPRYHHDRLVCTLSAMIALALHGDPRDRNRLQRALAGFDTASRGLRADPVGATIGFEMIAPALVDEASQLGIIRRQEDMFLSRALNHYEAALKSAELNMSQTRRGSDDYLALLAARRLAKLQALPAGKVNRHITVAFSAEMAGKEGKNLFDLERIQESNGSIGHSPSATAYFALYVKPGDEAAMTYLRRMLAVQLDGVPFAAPFDVFERSWVAWNLQHAGPLDPAISASLQPHLDYLQAAWRPGRGIGFSASYSPTDGDDTSVVFEVLHRAGQPVDIEGLLSYELEDRFRCYEYEADPSISVNCHVLSALRQAGYPPGHPTVDKVVRFLRTVQLLDSFWLDKWHASPYYPTAHIVIASAGYIPELARSAVDWIVETQNLDGSWGYYLSTAEETAYCLQALICWQRNGGKLPGGAIQRALDWLAGHMDPPYPPMWIGKCLYCPVLVVRSAILSALMMGAQE